MIRKAIVTIDLPVYFLEQLDSVEIRLDRVPERRVEIRAFGTLLLSRRILDAADACEAVLSLIDLIAPRLDTTRRDLLSVYQREELEEQLVLMCRD